MNATDETVELLRQLIRNACVNDGDASSGHESRNAGTLAGFLSGPGIHIETFEPAPGRTSLVARLEGTDPGAPSLGLLAHTDVVPAEPTGWRHDPFGGELVDGEVWGRGAVDMLNYVASMAVAVRELARGPRPRGTLLFVATADEEAGGTYGAKWLTQHAADRVRCDFALTEGGGYHLHGARHGVLVGVGQKGHSWRRVHVRGVAGHGSRPFRTDNALVKAATVVSRLAEVQAEPSMDEVWRRLVSLLDVPDDARQGLVDPARLLDSLGSLPDDLARYLHSVAHTSVSPNALWGSDFKTNTVPGDACVDVDVRTAPGHDEQVVDALFERALAPLRDDVVVETLSAGPSSDSPVDTPLWAALERATARTFPGAVLTPTYTTAFTDAGYFRALGTIAYGFTHVAPELDLGTLTSRAHARDERIDIRSLALSTDLWTQVARALLW